MEIKLSLIRKFNIITISFIYKLKILCDSNKNSTFLMCENWQIILKFVLKIKVSRLSDTVLRKKKRMLHLFEMVSRLDIRLH